MRMPEFATRYLPGSKDILYGTFLNSEATNFLKLSNLIIESDDWYFIPIPPPKSTYLIGIFLFISSFAVFFIN